MEKQKKSLKKQKLIDKKIDERSLIIFQKNLKKDTKVKITNLLNNKSILARVGANAKYPSFYNAVLSKRIFDESWQIKLGQQSIVVCTQKEANRLALDVDSFNTPSILGYALLTNNLTKTNDFFSDNQTLTKSLKGGSIFAKFPDFIGGNLIIAENILHFPWNEGFD